MEPMGSSESEGRSDDQQGKRRQLHEGGHLRTFIAAGFRG